MEYFLMFLGMVFLLHFTISERVGIPFYPSGASINVENLKALKLFSAIQW